MPLTMKPVVSSHILEIGYDDEKEEFFVRYAPTRKNPAGALVAYSGVDAETAASIESAPSIGSAIRDQIRDQYQFRYL